MSRKGNIRVSRVVFVSDERGEKMPHCNAIIRECIGYVEEILREKGKL